MRNFVHRSSLRVHGVDLRRIVARLRVRELVQLNVQLTDATLHHRGDVRHLLVDRMHLEAS